MSADTPIKKLLVVDDEEEICDFLKLFFEDREYQVEVAYDGEKALKLIEQTRPHVVLLDIQMPHMDGLTALKTIKAQYADVKVIMVTALETRERIEVAMRLGADNYITKPLSLEYLEKDVQEKIEQLSSKVVSS